MTEQYDTIVLGGGPGGYATALRAKARGLKVALVAESSEVGGTCLHRGCVPSKALLHAAGVQAEFKRLRGEAAGEAPELSAADLQRLRGDVVGRLHGGLVGLLRSAGVDLIEGRGRLAGAGQIELADGTSLAAANLVLATGSLPRGLEGVSIDGEVIVDSDSALVLGRIPRRPVIIGGGAVGVEFASMWHRLGASVTLVEVADRMLLGEDQASSDFLASALRRKGIDIRLSKKVLGIERRDGEAALIRLEDDELECDLVMIATGRVPNTAGSGAVELGLTDGRGFVKVDAYGQTELDGVWAVGDVVPTLALAHAAFAEGFVVADRIAGIDAPAVEHHLIPRVTYCDPEVASVGLTEAQARERHGEVAVTVASMAGNARAVIEATPGQVKLVTSAAGELLGVHVVGPMATELIGHATLATTWGAYVDEVAAITLPHPTFSESLREAFLSAAGLPFHVHR